MEKSEDMPIWVFLAFSSINTRRGALSLIWTCLVYSVYCIPWSLYFVDHSWVATFFLIDDWSWVAIMVPVLLWYWLSLRWLDNNSGWVSPALS